MPTPEEHADRRRALAATTSAAILAQWRKVDPDVIGRTWAAQVPAATGILTAAQMSAASTAEDYLDEFSPVAEGEVDPRQFAGRASDGGALASLLYQPAIGALMSIGSGASPARALAGAGASLDMIVRTQVADAGRAADQVALTARRTISGYVRQLVPPTCSRCTVLAGRWYRWNAGFQRHPRCDCMHVPATREQWRNDPRFHDPRQVYDSLSVAQRQRAGWSLADQQAIADGADLTVVTNMKGVTSSGAKRRAGRPLPSEIYQQAGSRDEAIRLLREHGYIRGGTPSTR